MRSFASLSSGEPSKFYVNVHRLDSQMTRGFNFCAPAVSKASRFTSAGANRGMYYARHTAPKGPR
jgi:hypothetical protein